MMYRRQSRPGETDSLLKPWNYLAPTELDERVFAALVPAEHYLRQVKSGGSLHPPETKERHNGLDNPSTGEPIEGFFSSLPLTPWYESSVWLLRTKADHSVLQSSHLRFTPALAPWLLRFLRAIRVRLDYRSDHEEFVRSFTGLKQINEKPAAEFWKEVRGK